MKKKIILALVLILAFALVFTACRVDDDKDIASINIDATSIAAEYDYGSTPDLSGIKVTVTYKDGTTDTVGADKLTVSPLDTSSAGEKTVTVKYEGFEDKITVTVKAPVITSIRIVAGTVAESVKLGGVLDVSNLKVEAVYSDGTVKVAPASEVTVTPFSTAEIGEKTLTVTYAGFTAIKKITVTGVVSITVDAGSVKNEIYVGESLDTSSLSVLVKYSDGKEAVVEADDLSITGIDNTTAGEKKLLITYEGFTYEYKINVVGPTSIKLNAGTYDSKVFVGTTHSTENLTALVTFSNGQVKTMKAGELTVSAIDTTTVGEKTLTVSYLTVSCDVPVKVVGVKSITAVNYEKDILIGGSYDMTAVDFNVVYTDDTTALIEAKDVTYASFVNPNTAGVQTITATYLDGTAEFTVKVCAIVGLEVTGLPTHVVAGEVLVLDNMKVYLVYENNVDGSANKVELTSGVTHNGDSLDFDVEGNKTFTVTYGNYTKDTVIPTEPPVLERIEIAGFTNKLGIGQTYDLSRVTVKAYYGNDTERVLDPSEYSLTAPATNVAGENDLVATLVDDATKTATVKVTVLPITSATLTGVPELLDINTELDLSEINLTVVYGNDEFRSVLTVDSGLTVSGYDKTVGGEQTVTVSYEYLDEAVTAKVYLKKIVSVEVLTFLGVVRQGYDFTLPEVEVRLTYNNGDTQTGLNSTFGIVLTSSKNEGAESYTVTASYTECGVTVESTQVIEPKTVLTIKSISALNGTIPTTLMVGEALPLDKIRLTVIYTDGENDYTYLIPLSDSNIIYGVISLDPLTGQYTNLPFDVTKSGNKSLTILFTDELIQDPVTKIPAFKYSATVVVNVIGVENLTVVDGTVNNKITIGQELDTSNIEVKVEYTDKSYNYIGTTNLDLVIEEPDVTTAGTKYLVIKFKGKEIKYQIEVYDPDKLDDGVIMGASLPSYITARNSYKNNFKDATLPYYVGDDNPFVFRLVLLVLDDNDNLVDSTSYVSTSKVEIKNGDSWTLVGSEYVTIDENKNSFKFTSEAVGKTFRITTAPEKAPSYSRSFDVEVVDGYNVTNPKELNLITNYGGDIDGSDMDLIKDDKLDVVNRFLAVNGIVRPAGQLNGIILHGNMNVKEGDIPAEYIYTAGGLDKKGTFDRLSLYDHVFDENHKEFNIYGNYYSIYTYSLPSVVKNGVANNIDEFSNSEIFRFRYHPDKSADIIVDGTVKTSDLKLNVLGLAMRDNDPNSNDQSASERHMLGLIGFKIASCTANFTNTNIEAYVTSMIAEYDNLTVNLDKVKFYNAWQGHLFLYSHNVLAQDCGLMDAAPTEYYENMKINITDSLLGKCGGPVILSQNDYDERTCNDLSGADVVVDAKSELYAYVTGQEAWFVALGQTTMAGQILALNNFFEGMGKKAGISTSLTSQQKIQGVDTFNLVYVVMGIGMDGYGKPGDFRGTFTRLDENGNPAVQGLNMNDLTVTGLRAQIMAGAGEDVTAGASAPIFQTSAGGVMWTDMTNFNLVPGTEAGCMQGEYVTIYMLGLGIMVEYYNPTNPDQISALK